MSDVTEFLDRCEDVLTDWHGSGDAMHCSRGVPIDAVEAPFTFRFDRTPLVIAPVDVNGGAFGEALRAAYRAEAIRVADLHQCRCDVDTEHHTMPTDVRERALDARRNRNTGPQPRRLDGRRKR